MQFILIPHYILHCRQCPGSELYSFSATKLRSQFPLTAQKSADAFSVPAVSIILLSNTVTLNLSSAAAMHIILENTVPHMAHCRKAVTAFCHDRPIIFFIALCDPAVALSVACRQYIQRRNCQRRPAVRTLFGALLQKQRQSQLFAMTALSSSLLLCVTPPLHYLLPVGNISKGGICRAPRAPPH